MDNFVGIVVGFALTTVVGGWWAWYLQGRSWTRQNDARLQEEARERAGAACQDLMALLDRRLYRMQRLCWAATAVVDGSTDGDELERRQEEYVDVLFSWNDRLNTNLSLVGSYFGDEARIYLDGMNEDFKRVGQDVEALVRAARAGQETTAIASQLASEFGGGADSLNDRVYQFGLMLMGQLREDRVGRAAPNTSTPRPTP